MFVVDVAKTVKRLLGFYICIDENCGLTFTVSDRTPACNVPYNSALQVVCPRCLGQAEKVL